MRTLYIILCQTRAWELTFDNLARNCLDSLPADLALCVGTRHENRDNPFYRRAKYVWAHQEDDDGVRVWDKESYVAGEKYAAWYDQVDQELGGRNTWRKLLDPEISRSLMGPITQGGSGSILYFFRYLLLKRLRAEECIAQYDWFVISRSDFQHLLPHPPVELLDPEKIYVPDGEQYCGMTDRHIVLSRKLVEPVLSTVHDIWLDTDAIHAQLKEIGLRCRTMGPETILLALLQRHGLDCCIKWYPYTMFAVRGEQDGTRWQQGHFVPELGCYLKYSTEYEQYLKYKEQIVTASDWQRFL